MSAPRMTYEMARAASWDAGNRSMRGGGRLSWNEDDFHAACAELSRIWWTPSAVPALGWLTPTCHVCGEDATEQNGITDQSVCPEHRDPEDGPMGAMGHGADYSDRSRP